MRINACGTPTVRVSPALAILLSVQLFYPHLKIMRPWGGRAGRGWGRLFFVRSRSLCCLSRREGERVSPGRLSGRETAGDGRRKGDRYGDGKGWGEMEVCRESGVIAPDRRLKQKLRTRVAAPPTQIVSAAFASKTCAERSRERSCSAFFLH